MQNKEGVARRPDSPLSALPSPMMTQCSLSFYRRQSWMTGRDLNLSEPSRLAWAVVAVAPIAKLIEQPFF